MKRLLPAFLLALCCLPLRAADPSPEALACFQWFASLEFPDVQKAPFALYTDGSWSDHGNGPRPDENSGFITEDGEGKFKILTLDWEVKEMQKSEPGTPAHEIIGWKESDFGACARAFLADLRRPKGEEETWRHIGERLRHPAKTFGCAYTAWRRGLPDTPQELFDEAIRGWTPADFRAQMERDFADAIMWRSIVAFGGGDWFTKLPLVSRKELLARFENLVRCYPGSPHIPRASETATMLKQMIAEDDAHPAITEEALKALPAADQVRELIFRLRDQNGHQVFQPGWCDIFNCGKTGDTPAHRLAEIGLDAVPDLISSLSDERFCRSVGFSRDFYFSHTVLTIGDCALAILQRIAGRTFYEHRKSSGDDQEPAPRKEVEAWWSAVQTKGIKQTLIEQISSGELNPAPLASKLAALHQESLVPALLQGAAKTNSSEIRRDYYSLLGATSDPRALEFVLKRMHEADTPTDRVAAICALMPARRQEVLDALLEEWRTLDPGAQDDASLFVTIAEQLARSRDRAAIEAFGFHWKQRSALQRYKICNLLERALGPRGFRDEKGKVHQAPLDTIIAGENILVHALDDKGVRVNAGGSWGDGIFITPSIATVANWALHQIKPATYAFSISSKTADEQREVERVAAINAWRKENGQPLLPAAPVRPDPQPEDGDAK